MTLLVAAATNFNRYDDLGGDPAARVRQYLEKVQGKSFDHLRAEHVAEHQRLFRRVRSGSARERGVLAAQQRVHPRLRSPPRPATGRLVVPVRAVSVDLEQSARLSAGEPARHLERGHGPRVGRQVHDEHQPGDELLAGGGRRLAGVRGAAGRDGQGTRRDRRPRGQAALRSGRLGVHQNTDQWRAAAPMDGATWGPFAVGGAWLCTHLWDHYRYTGDKEYLRRVYPLLKGSAEFFLDTLVEYPKTRSSGPNPPKWLVTCPSTSPENFPARPGNKPFHDRVINFNLPGTTISAGSTIDMSILRDLFDACVAAGKILDVDQEFGARVAAARRRLAPLQIGKRGNLQEWIEDWGDLEQQHRHISHLYSLYPSNQISPDTDPKLAAAAKVSLDERGDHGTGFGMAWKAACWARLRRRPTGQSLSRKSHGPANLSEPLLQMFSGSAGGRLVRSQRRGRGNVVAVAAGRDTSVAGPAQGLGRRRIHRPSARGGFTVDAAWKGSRLTSATVRSTLGGPCTIRASCGISVKDVASEPVQTVPGEYTIRFGTVPGGRYTILPQAQDRKPAT